MLFKPEHIPMVLSGAKTQTRRLGKARWVVGNVHPVKRDFYGKPVGWIRILSVHQEPLGAITEDGAKAEGYSSVQAYRSAWERIYRHHWQPDLLVWVVSFCPHDGPTPRTAQTTLFEEV